MSEDEGEFETPVEPIEPIEPLGREVPLEPVDLAETVDRLERTPTFGTGAIVTGIGSVMLGLEQALRSQPPPEVMAAEHRPERGLSGPDDELVLLFPDGPVESPSDEPARS